MSLSLFGALWLALVATAPLWLVVTACVDLASSRRVASLRAFCFFLWFLSCEAVGVLASALFTPLAWMSGDGGERFLRVHYAFQRLWSRALLAGAGRLYSLTFDVEGEEVVAPGPALLLVRHASVGDTLLPAVFASGPHGLRLRYVLKRELLWDPCLDIVGNRLPNAFVTRGSDDSAGQIAKVRELASGLSAREGVLIFPEGTRFTEAKRARVIERLEERGERRALLEAARALEHTLPPQLGGVTATLDAAPDADVVFCAHTGFEGISTMRELLLGSFVGRRIHVRFWRVPRASVPDDDERRVEWLLEQWAELDRWVDRVQLQA
jgi:1-acyl-sn-glycerol-3-phosphate acyltransferase